MDDAREPHYEQPLMKLLGLKRIPGARTLGNALRRMGSSQPAQQAFLELSKRALSASREMPRTVHTMNDTHHVFVLLVKRTLIEEP